MLGLFMEIKSKTRRRRRCDNDMIEVHRLGRLGRWIGRYLWDCFFLFLSSVIGGPFDRVTERQAGLFCPVEKKGGMMAYFQYIKILCFFFPLPISTRPILVHSIFAPLSVMVFYAFFILSAGSPNRGTLQALHRADASRLRNQFSNGGLTSASLSSHGRDRRAVERNLQVIRGGETGLEGLPDLLLRVQHLFGLALAPALEEDALTGLSVRGRVDQLDGTGVRVLALGDAGGGGQHHCTGLDAAHGDGLEVADGDDLAALHLLERDEAVQTRADGADCKTGFLVHGGVLGAGSIATVNGRDVEGIGVGVVDRAQDVTDTQVDEGWGWRRSRCRSRLGLLLLLLFLFLLLLLLGWRCPFSSRLGSLGSLSLLRLALSNDKRLLAGCTLRRSSSLLLLLLDGFRHEQDLVGVDADLLLLRDPQAEQLPVLNKVDVSHNVVVAVLPRALLRSPLLHERSQKRVGRDIGDGRLRAQEGRPRREVGVQVTEEGRGGGLVILAQGSRQIGDGCQPFLDLRVLSVRVGVVREDLGGGMEEVGLRRVRGDGGRVGAVEEREEGGLGR